MELNERNGGDVATESINLFKEVLLSTITKLNESIDFLKNELEERNLLIRTLLLREAILSTMN